MSIKKLAIKLEESIHSVKLNIDRMSMKERHLSMVVAIALFGLTAIKTYHSVISGSLMEMTFNALLMLPPVLYVVFRLDDVKSLLKLK